MLEVCSPNNLEKRLPNQEAFPHWSQVIYGGCRSEAAELKTGHDIRMMRMYALWILWESICEPPGSPPIAEHLADYAQRKSPADQELILAFLYSQVRKTCWHIFAELQCCQTLKWLEHPAKVSVFGKQIHLSANSCLQLWGTFQPEPL